MLSLDHMYKLSTSYDRVGNFFYSDIQVPDYQVFEFDANDGIGDRDYNLGINI